MFRGDKTLRDEFISNEAVAKGWIIVVDIGCSIDEMGLIPISICNWICSPFIESSCGKPQYPARQRHSKAFFVQVDDERYILLLEIRLPQIDSCSTQNFIFLFKETVTLF